MMSRPDLHSKIYVVMDKGGKIQGGKFAKRRFEEEITIYKIIKRPLGISYTYFCKQLGSPLEVLALYFPFDFE